LQLGGDILKDLINKAMHGDEESFYKIINENKEKLYRIAYSYVRNEQDALDIFQDAVCKAFVAIKELKEPDFFNTWLTRIVINCSINYLRKSKRIVYTEDYYSETDKSDLNGVEDLIDLYKALDKLEAKYKSVVMLKYFEDKTLQEISEILNLPLSTVKSHLYRALDKLQIDLKEVQSFE